MDDLGEEALKSYRKNIITPECTQWELNPPPHADQHSSLTLCQCVHSYAEWLISGQCHPGWSGFQSHLHWSVEVITSLSFVLELFHTWNIFQPNVFQTLKHFPSHAFAKIQFHSLVQQSYKYLLRFSCMLTSPLKVGFVFSNNTKYPCGWCCMLI